MKLAEAMFRFYDVKSDFTDRLCTAGFGNYSGDIWGDDYDNSIEFGQVDPDARLTEEQQRIIFDEGFTLCFVNHTDGWETHYSWKHADFKPHRGWRRKRTDKGFTINYWPESWGEDTNGWLASGYMTIEADA